MTPAWEDADRELQLAEQQAAEAQEYRDAAADADHHDHRRPDAKERAELDAEAARDRKTGR